MRSPYKANRQRKLPDCCAWRSTRQRKLPVRRAWRTTGSLRCRFAVLFDPKQVYDLAVGSDAGDAQFAPLAHLRGLTDLQTL